MDFEEFCELMMTSPEDNDWLIDWLRRAKTTMWHTTRRGAAFAAHGQ
jgi:hypothetical protein